MTTTSKNGGTTAGTRPSSQASRANASVTSRASDLLQSGVERVKSNPGMAAAIVGGVAAAAAATVYRDKIGETIGSMRGTSGSNSHTSGQTH